MRNQRRFGFLTVSLLLGLLLVTDGCINPFRLFFRHDLRGQASWYGEDYHGRTTANGERYNMYALTAAHRTLPFNTRVRVTNLKNGRRVVVRINDRGPWIRGRVIDLSYEAARRIRMVEDGLVPVIVEVID